MNHSDGNLKDQPSLQGNEPSFADAEREEFDLKVKKIISKQLGRAIKDLKGEMSLKADLGADSLDLVSLVLALEEDLGVELADAEAAKIVTIQDAINVYWNLKPTTS
ncbi:hypothetical protein BH10BDE1_BH10BDE1_07890 [soil metagenome]